MSDIKSTFFNITKNLTKTSGDLVKNTKLNMDLAGAEEELKQVYIEIGRKVHEIYRYGGSLGEFFDEKYHDINTAQQKIDDIKKQIDTIKGVKVCPKCGKNAERNAEFCPGCGYRLEGVLETVPGEPAIKTEPVATPPETQDERMPPLSGPSTNQYTDTDEEPVGRPMPAQAPADKKICTACGGMNEPASKFCLFCGRILS